MIICRGCNQEILSAQRYVFDDRGNYWHLDCAKQSAFEEVMKEKYSSFYKMMVYYGKLKAGEIVGVLREREDLNSWAFYSQYLIIEGIEDPDRYESIHYQKLWDYALEMKLENGEFVVTYPEDILILKSIERRKPPWHLTK